MPRKYSARSYARSAEQSYNRSFYPGPERFRLEPGPARLCASGPAHIRPASAQGGHQGKSGVSWLRGQTMVTRNTVRTGEGIRMP